MIRFKFIVMALATALVSACASVPPGNNTSTASASVSSAMPGMQAPAGGNYVTGEPRLEWAQSLSYEASGPFSIDLASIPTGAYDPNTKMDRATAGGRIDSPISDDEAALLREEALLMPPQFGMYGPEEAAPGQLGPAPGVSFESIDFSECCGGGGSAPPDSELAVGPNHIIAVVNVSFVIYDKTGTLLQGPTTFSSFFAGTTGCSNTGVFDPNVLYDESADRFILGIDGNGTDYCVAASTTADPTATWHRYGFATDIGGNFFDYPHAGVGLDAIYMGANMFGAGFAEGRVWAIDKTAMYAGDSLSVETQSIGNQDTPQPMNLHGFNQGTWPLAGPHYIVTDAAFNGANYGVWSWDDPFGANSFSYLNDVNLTAFIGGTQGIPVDFPQAGTGAANLQANDFRVQDAEYRNGDIWISNTVSCNPGSGTVNCVRWAQIDPTGPTILDAGIYASNGEYRQFADVAANHCDDLAIGYTKSSTSMFPSVFVNGRKSTDAPGTLQIESQLKAGEVTYTSFSNDPRPHRWGDYTGMTIDPDGLTFWYLGQYSKDIPNVSKWANYIGSFSFPDCTVGGQTPGKASNPSPSNSAVDVDVNADVSWSAGSDATSHDVFFGTNPVPAGAEFIANQTGTSYDPGLLLSSTTYYWRIDEVNAQGTTTGNVWNFTTAPPAPGQAGNPSPVTGATNVDVEADLSWTAGSDADSYDVYLNGSFRGNTTGTFFDPGTLDENTAYNWRVDAINATDTTPGDTWTFTTGAAPELPKFNVADIAVVTIQAKGSRNRGQATVTVEDAVGAPVPGVAVSGTFDGDWSGTRGDTTDSNGQIVVETPPVKNGNSWTFCVDTASKAGWVPDQTVNPFLWCNAPVTTGSIAGVVTDSSGPIAGASVSADTGQSDTTDASGNYSLASVPTGSRDVTVSASGYITQSQSTVVTDGSTSPLNFELAPVPVGTGSVQVRSITVSAVNQGKGNKSGQAVVVVEDENGSAVANATVTGDFSGTFVEPAVTGDPTDGSGSTTIVTSGQAKGGVTVTFCVTAITHPSLNDFSGNECATF